MSEDLNVFPNAKSPLFGAGEDSVGIITTPAVAGLTGSLVINTSSFDDSEFQGGPVTSNFQRFSNVLITTEFAQNNVGTLKVGTKVVCVVCGLVGNSFLLQRNGSTITTLVPTLNPSNPDYFSSFIDTITVEASYTYGLRVVSSPVAAIGAVNFLTFPIEPDDTHAGFIETVAVAGKNIITADSHTTREISVLPG